MYSVLFVLHHASSSSSSSSRVDWLPKGERRIRMPAIAPVGQAGEEHDGHSAALVKQQVRALSAVEGVVSPVCSRHRRGVRWVVVQCPARPVCAILLAESVAATVRVFVGPFVKQGMEAAPRVLPHKRAAQCTQAGRAEDRFRRLAWMHVQMAAVSLPRARWWWRRDETPNISMPMRAVLVESLLFAR